MVAGLQILFYFGRSQRPYSFKVCRTLIWFSQKETFGHLRRRLALTVFRYPFRENFPRKPKHHGHSCFSRAVLKVWKCQGAALMQAGSPADLKPLLPAFVSKFTGLPLETNLNQWFFKTLAPWKLFRKLAPKNIGVQIWMRGIVCACGMTFANVCHSLCGSRSSIRTLKSPFLRETSGTRSCSRGPVIFLQLTNAVWSLEQFTSLARIAFEGVWVLFKRKSSRTQEAQRSSAFCCRCF